MLTAQRTRPPVLPVAGAMGPTVLRRDLGGTSLLCMKFMQQEGSRLSGNWGQDGEGPGMRGTGACRSEGPSMGSASEGLQDPHGSWLPMLLRAQRGKQQ